MLHTTNDQQHQRHVVACQEDNIKRDLQQFPTSLSPLNNHTMATTAAAPNTCHYPFSSLYSNTTTPMNPTATTSTKPAFPYHNKKERTTYVAGGSSYISFPLVKQENNIHPKKPPTLQKTTTTAIPQPNKPFKCHECGQTFSRSHNLKSHSATHSLVRPYKCDTCSREFRRLHDLKRHQKLHTGERPYVCSTCDRSFSRLDALNRHLKAEISCDRSKRNNIKEKSASTPIPSSSSSSSSSSLSPPTNNNEPRRSSAPTLPSFHEQDEKRTTLLPPILFSSFDTLTQKSFSPPSTMATIDHRAETDQLKRQIHDLQVENRLLRSLVMESAPIKNQQQQQSKRCSSAKEISSSPVPMDWRKSL